MNIEKDIFKKSKVIFNKLKSYGFKKIDDKYKYEKYFLNNSFKVEIYIDKNGIVNGKVIDVELNEEYKNIRTNMNGSFVNSVREEYKNILIDIKNNCFNTNNFIYDQTNRICEYIKNTYNVLPEFLWDKTPDCGVFRNKNNNKWFGIIMNIDKSKICDGSGEIEVINVKVDRNNIDELLNIKGIYEAYHMNKKSWISIILDDTLNDYVIYSLIDESYKLVVK